MEKETMNFKESEEGYMEGEKERGNVVNIL